ncbi:MAG: iron ABC transporter substrate-binding protein [Desulfovibrio sp.]|nr:iron ABC transporter substrate-binding protein [Desulfovibrio sp.]
MKRSIGMGGMVVLVVALFLPARASAKEIADSFGRILTVPDGISRVICSGSGCLRLLTYLTAQDAIVGVDSIEKQGSRVDVRPYALANPRFKNFPLFGEFRGKDNPELILALNPAPQVIFKVDPKTLDESITLEEKTGIPVVTLRYGDLLDGRAAFYASLRTMGGLMGKSDRAEKVVAFFEETIADLEKRTRDIPEADRTSVFLGGVAFAGPHGFLSTEPAYAPFSFVHARNPAYSKQLKADISKEKIVEWNPDVIFLDLATMRSGDKSGGLYELQNDTVYRSLSAVKSGKVYGLIPHNSYNTNFESTMANAYFVGKLLYPDRFQDVDPASKADAIFGFLDGKPLFAQLNEMLGGYVFAKLPVQE